MRKKMNQNNCLLAACSLATVLLLSGNSAFAQDFTTDDSVMTLTLPDKEGWEQVEDSHTWMTLSNGTDRITLLHYRNGEPLPAITIADQNFSRTCQSILSTRNEVFIITGSAAKDVDFDEIEKAHPDVMNMLLQILDDGRLTDAQGRTVNFKNTVIIMTSNIGARLITDKTTLGFTDNRSTEESKQKDYENTKKDVMSELKKQFRPEFINRIDEIIVFHKLNEDDIKQIIDIMLKQVIDRLKQQDYNVEFDDKVKEYISKKGVDINYGARPLKRAIQSYIEDKVAEAILDGVIVPNKKVKISVDNDNIIIK